MEVNVADDARVAIFPYDDDADAAFEAVCRDNPTMRVEQKPTGEIIVLSPAGNESSNRNTHITSQLQVWNARDQRGVVFDSNTVFRLPDASKLGPDTAWVSKQRLRQFPRRERKKFLSIVPEFIIELRSETDRLPDLQSKMLDWMTNGVELGWLIEADAREVWVYEGLDVKHIIDPVCVIGTGPVAGFELVMADIYTGLDF